MNNKKGVRPFFLKPKKGLIVIMEKYGIKGEPNDPWFVGFVKEIDEYGYYIIDGSNRGYKHARIITSEEGKQLIEEMRGKEHYAKIPGIL